VSPLRGGRERGGESAPERGHLEYSYLVSLCLIYVYYLSFLPGERGLREWEEKSLQSGENVRGDVCPCSYLMKEARDLCKWGLFKKRPEPERKKKRREPERKRVRESVAFSKERGLQREREVPEKWAERRENDIQREPPEPPEVQRGLQRWILCVLKRRCSRRGPPMRERGRTREKRMRWNESKRTCTCAEAHLKRSLEIECSQRVHLLFLREKFHFSLFFSLHFIIIFHILHVLLQDIIIFARYY